ncbi:hypothetical protein [Arthrobacter sp. PAMC25284]|uniref:hypothetical protein n=1 Tax=Arthrobacter sp. PAMC25284 TaxID=2861279 RepID=UPI001C6349B0|nr:hypothetical protein [Arthrobacter sp. PAMC25284]QYF89895.1 hypothetical protein KY499_00290 [Arthrobacter sp. PAMC25284]
MTNFDSETTDSIEFEEVKGSGFPGERSYDKAKLKLHYLFQKSTTESKYLIVVFSAIPKIGHSPVYNYVRTLSPVACNRLFILDEYGPSASYYLGRNRDFAVEESVIALIRDLSREHGFDTKHIISMGSSKGGFAALYFGIKYSFGHVISAAPQTRLGNFVFNNHRDVGEYISGGLSDVDREFLNTLLPIELERATYIPQIYLHVGRGDHHYKGHVVPFVELLKEMGADHVLDVQEYELHSEVGRYFPGFLFSTLNSILS